MNALDLLSEQTGRPFNHLKAARTRTQERLAIRLGLADSIEADPDVSIVLMGSWGRAELTSGSDDDFMVLVHGGTRTDVRPSVTDVAEAFAADPQGFKDPGREGIFGKEVFSAQLRDNIGLEDDSNANLTRRLLLLLESVPLSGADQLAAARTELLEEYLKDALRDYRPPRFFLNDVARYWRTVGVDFAAKMRRRNGAGWALRNAKLRTSRKLLYASGLLPILRCHEFKRSEMVGFIEEQLRLPPTDRVADAFLHYGDLEHGSQVFDAYDKFIRLIDDPGERDLLDSLEPAEARSSEPFQIAAQLGAEIDAGLLGLLFGPALTRWTKEYAVL
jgi:hypothetical protein